MATNQLRRVLQSLRGITSFHQDDVLSDGQLLESYLRTREEAALAALVHRHGPMVWGVCRRLLRSHHDAEDAFQATFLVLVRKAASVVPKELVGNWLYGVAHQTALKARATTARRRTREKQVSVMPEPIFEPPVSGDDLQSLLDQELSRLPDKYRAVIVLCDLEGKTRKDAARHFGLPEGTVASRLATARSLLARRLARSGSVVSSAALATTLSQNVATASVPSAVATATIKAATLFALGQATAPGVVSVKAVALAKGVLKTMLLTKLKIATAVLVLVAFVGTGAAALTLRGSTEKKVDPSAKEKRVLSDKPAERPVKEKKEPAQPESEKKEVDLSKLSVSGVVKAVDAATNMLTVAHREGEDTFTVAKDANVSIDGKLARLAALPTGANITLSQFVDPKTARDIQASGSWWPGVLVKAVDAEKRTVTFTADEYVRGSVHRQPREVAGKTMPVAQDAHIVVDGKPGNLAALPPGAFVVVHLCADQKTVGSLDATGPDLGGHGGSLVKAIDVEKRTITFDDNAHAEVAGKTFTLARDASIVIDGKPGMLAEVPVGCYVDLSLRADGQTVGQLRAQGPSNLCDCGGSPVTAIDAEKGTITFDDKTRAKVSGKTYAVAKDVLVTIDSKPGKLADLPSGTYVSVALRVDQTVGRIVAQGPSNVCDFGGSLVTAIDVEKRTITFADKARAEVAGKTFTLAKDALVSIDGKPGKLTDVPSGSYVQMNLCSDRRTVGMIFAQGPSNVCDCGGSLVTAIDVEKRTITFTDKARAEVAGKTFTPAKDALVSIDGKPGTLTDVPSGSYVQMNLCSDRRTVGMIFAQGPPVPGVGLVKAVDAAKNLITVEDITYPVAKNANILVDEKPTQLAGVRAGIYVTLRLCVDQKTVGTIFHTKAPDDARR
jgi:RNA polymerase sigma factor (sigma-70 family)